MKRLLLLLFVVLAPPAFAGTFNATYNLIDFVTRPYSVRQLRIQTVALYGVNSNSIISGDFRDFQVGTNGSVTVSNLVNGRSYKVSFYGPNIITVFTNSFDTNVTGTVNAADYIGGLVVDGASAGWTRNQADSRFLRTNITQYLTQGTNIVFVTNGNNITIHGTATGSGSATNAIEVAAGNGIDVATNSLLRTISLGSGVTNQWRIDATNIARNISFRTNYVFEVSSRGIANGLSAFTNDNKQFGPDTPGTTTSGLQEAYNYAVTNRTMIGPEAIGVRLNLDGYYYFTNTLMFSNNWTAALTLAGADQVATKLVYAGSNSGVYTIDIRGGARKPTVSSLILPMSVSLRNIGFAAINDATNVLVRATNYSHMDVEECNFTSWLMMTNQDWGAGMSIVGAGSAPQASSLVGLVAGNGGENGTIIRGCNFGGLACGVHFMGDHIYGNDITFSLIGFGELNSSVKWTTNSLYNLKPCYLFGGSESGSYINSMFINTYFYDTVGGFVMYNPTANEAMAINVIGLTTESSDKTYAAVNTNLVKFRITYATDDGFQAQIITNGGFGYVNVSTLEKQRYIYENNLDAPSETFQHTRFNSLETTTGYFYGRAGGLSNFVNGIKLTNVFATLEPRFTLDTPGLINEIPARAFFEAETGASADKLWFKSESASGTNVWWWFSMGDFGTGVQGNFGGATNISYIKDKPITITSLAAGHQLAYSGAAWTNGPAPGGSGTPGGSDTQVQYNDGGAFGAEAAFTYNKTIDKLTVPDFTTTGVTRLGSLAYAYGLSAGGFPTGYLAIAADGEIRAVETPAGSFMGPFTNLDIYTNFDLITHSPNGFSNFWAFNASHTNIQVNLTNQAAGSVSYISVLDIGTNGVATSLGWLGDSVRTTNFPAPRTLNYEADKTNVIVNAALANENRWKFTLTATNHFLLQITNPQFDMQEIIVRVKQDATGNWQGYTTNTISGGDSIPIPADKSLSILPAPPTANKVTYLGFIYNATSNVWHYTELREGF